MATLTIPDSTYHRLKEMATARQIPLEQLLDQVASVGDGNMRPNAAPDIAARMAAFDAWVASHLPSQTIADDSRDAIYGDERE